MSRLKNILNFIKDILSPKKCLSCRKEGMFLCDNCFNNLDNFEPFCYICKKNSQKFKIHKKCLIENKLFNGSNFNNKKIFLDRIIVMTHYKNELIKKLIISLKFYFKRDIGVELGERLGFFLKNNKFLEEYNKDDFVIMPVPLHFFRKIKRGFNQSEILAKNIAKILNVNYNKKIIIRKKHTRQQAKLSRQKRLINLDKSFKIKKNNVDIIDNKIIILVDDVISSGTTLNEIAKVLKQNGAKKVIGVCVASN